MEMLNFSIYNLSLGWLILSIVTPSFEDVLKYSIHQHGLFLFFIVKDHRLKSFQLSLCCCEKKGFLGHFMGYVGISGFVHHCLFFRLDENFVVN